VAGSNPPALQAPSVQRRAGASAARRPTAKARSRTSASEDHVVIAAIINLVSTAMDKVNVNRP
jgi:hypothetical protein